MKKIFNIVAAVALLFAVASVNAATFTVTNTNDSGAGSLRDAITQANTSPAPNTVNFDPVVTGSIILTSGQIRIAGPMAIVGPGAAVLSVDGNAIGRIFSVYVTSPVCPTVDNGGIDYLVSISGLTLTNAVRGSSWSGGAIWSEHSLNLDSVIVSNSVAASGAGLVFNLQYTNQTLTINNSQFLNNTAKPWLTPPSSYSHWGAAVHFTERCGSLPSTSPAAMNITNSLFSGNRIQPEGLSAYGGAISIWSRADISITDTRIVDNHIDVPNPPVAGKLYRGGGIYGTGKSLTILRSEIAENSVIDVTGSDLSRGGGVSLYNQDPGLQTPGSAMTATITNSTIADNAVSATAGAIYLWGNVALELDNTTVSNNTAANGRTGGVYLVTGATTPASASNATAPTLKLVSSIIANSSATTSDVGSNSSVIPSFTIDASNSLIQTICSTCNISVSGSGNLLSVDPMLGTLVSNGGATRTRALLAGSPAINAGSNPLNLTTDQRGTGFARVVNGTADMGAYEFSTARLINLSTRGPVQTGDNVMIGGFVIGGSTPKKVLIKVAGPNLANYGVTGVLADPTLQLFSGQTPIASNNDWGSASNVAEIQATTLAPADAKESAILTTLSPGAYTAIVSGVGGGTGVGIVEVYDLDHPEAPLINISTRGKVQTGDGVMIGGFIIQGNGPQTVLIRAGGPTLANYGVTGALANPKLDLYSGQTVIATNDDWQTAANAAAITATGLAPVSPLESAILITLQPGPYTAIVSGVGGGTGVAIVEVFAQ